MKRLSVSLAVDGVMLLAFTLLMSWRLTGVPIHEWLGVGLLALAIAHLAIHGRWVEARAPKLLRDGSWRGRATVILNLSLFLFMGTALTSGVVISKVILPNGLTPGAWVTWHGVHDTSSTLTLIVLGLHIALNWDLIAGGLRRAVRLGIGTSSAMPGPASLVTLTRRLLWIGGVSAVLAFAVWQGGRRLPPTDTAMFYSRDGTVEERPVPPELTRMQHGLDVPGPSGAPRYALRAALLGVAAVVGRKLLKLRLE